MSGQGGQESVCACWWQEEQKNGFQKGFKGNRGMQGKGDSYSLPFPAIALLLPTHSNFNPARIQQQGRAWTHSPSVRRARPPVGVHSTEEQLPHRTTVCECENTVVLRTRWATWERGREGERVCFGVRLVGRPKSNCCFFLAHTHMLKHPWHLTSMKKLFGLCTQGAGERREGERAWLLVLLFLCV